MSTLDDAYYNIDYCRVMSEVTLRLCLNGHGNNPIDQQQALAKFESMLTSLVADGPPPADLSDHTDSMVAQRRQEWVDYKTGGEDFLALSITMQEVSPGTAEQAQAQIDLADVWIEAIDQEWTPGGGN